MFIVFVVRVVLCYCVDLFLLLLGYLRYLYIFTTQVNYKKQNVFIGVVLSIYEIGLLGRCYIDNSCVCTNN
jgi:hypothetical protein